MAQFTVHGRLKLLFNGDNLSMGMESKDPFQSKLVGKAVKVPKRTIGFSGANTGVRSSFSSKSSKKLGMTLSEEIQEEEEDDYDSENVVDEMHNFGGLVLDFSYRPIHVVCWKRAISLEFREKADVLEYYDQTVNSPYGSYNIPAVLRVPHLLQVVKRRRIRHPLSRTSILYRDEFTCQYCASHDNLTIDHVLPTSRGGTKNWENLVTACAKCNAKKGHKTIDEAKMELLRPPKAPKDYDILAIPLTQNTMRMLKRRSGTPKEWRQYLFTE